MVPNAVGLEECRLCPRDCGSRRAQGERGFCGQDERIFLARAALHFWEEPCLSGTKGSGTVFFSGCNLRCVFCQNRPVARGEAGREVSRERLAEIYLELQEKGAHNINLVTPSHYVPAIVRSLREARQAGLHIPVVYNTSAYEKPETLRMLEGEINIFLPDFKYWDEELSLRYSQAQDYREWARKALEEMVRQAGEPVFDEEGLMQSGVIVRHLLLPGCLGDAKKVLRYLHTTYGDHIYISLMNQYTPMPGVPEELARRVSRREYEELVDYALRIGITRGFMQEGPTAEESFIPAFDCEGVERKG